jgi:5-oxoprolinase (ATP-hydrolysing) subunit A
MQRRSIVDDPPLHHSIDLSCDIGEARSAAEQEREDAIWPLISSASIACGGHVGDAGSIRHAVRMGLQYGVRLGAHPSYPDRPNFGRKSLAIDRDALQTSLREQLASIAEIAAAAGGTIDFVKPHGALYNDAFHDGAAADVIAAACRAALPGAAILCAAGSKLESAAREQGIAVDTEAFADRRYLPDGRLMSRSSDEALLLDPADAARQALLLACRSRVVASDGRTLVVPFRTLTVHGDMPGAVERIIAIREALVARGIAVGRESSTLLPAAFPPFSETVLETARLRLRPLTAADAPDFARLADDPTVGRNTLTLPYPYTVDDGVEWGALAAKRWEEGSEAVFAITLRGTEEFIGVIGLGGNWRHRSGELGFWIGAPWRGAGLTGEAAARLIDWAFDDLAFERIDISHFGSNSASRRVIEKLGFVAEGIVRSAIVRWGVREDVHRYGLLSAEWRSRSSGAGPQA